MSGSPVLSALHALSHTAVSSASRHLLQSSSLVSNVTADAAESIYLSAFDRTLFYEVMIVYAAPCAVALCAGTLALFRSRFHLSLLPSWLLRDWLGSALLGAEADRDLLARAASGLGEDADSTFEFYLSWLYPSAVFLVVLVPFTILAFLVASVLLLDRMFGVSCSYLFFLAMLLTWTMLRWKFEEWRFTLKVKWLFITVALTVGAFELYKAFYARPYTFIGLGVFCLMINMLAMIHVSYLIREFKQIRFQEYHDINTPVLRDLEKQAAEAAAKNAAREKAQHEAAARAAQQKADAKMKAAQRALDGDDASDDEEEEHAAADPTRISVAPSADEEVEAYEATRAQQITGDLASRAHFQSKLSLPRALFAYLRALAALVGFAVIIDYAGFGTIGYITAAAIVWLDIVVLLWVYAQAERTPLQACLLLAMVRFFMIIFGAGYYLVGHSALFVLMGCYFSNELVERFLPRSKLRPKDDDEEEMQPQGYAPIRNLPSTAVRAGDRQISVASRAAAARRQRRAQRKGLHIQGLNVSHNVTQVLSLIFLVAAFIFDILLCYYLDDSVHVPAGLYTTLPQSVVGFFGLFVWLVFALSKLTFRVYVNQNYKSHGWVLFLALMQYMMILGAGWIYWYVAREKNLPVLCIFLPPLVYFLIGLFSQWVKNDFRIILPASHRNPPEASWLQAFAQGGFPGNDYFMVLGICACIGCIIALGFGLSWYIDPSWVGAMVAWVLVVLLTTVTPMVEYFHTFEVSLNMVVMGSISVISYFVGLIVTFYVVLDGESSSESFLLMLAGFGYPILLSLTMGIAKWHDDRWVISDVVVWSNFVSGLLLILMFFAIAMAFTPWWIGGGLMALEVVALMGVMVLPRIKELSPFWHKLICTASAVILFGITVSATLEDASGFSAFTMLCAIVFLGLLCVVYYAYRGSPYDAQSIFKHRTLIYSPHVFPIFEFDSMAKGKTNPLTEANQRVWSVYGLFGVAYAWGVMSLFFTQPVTVGMCISSLALVGVFLFTAEMRHRAWVRNDQFAEAVDYLEEGSEAYMQVLAQCKWIATKNQLLNDTSLYISTRKNKLAADVGIQTDTLTPGSLNLIAQQSIIAHLEFLFADQDWQRTKDKYHALDARLGKISCCGIRAKLDMEIDGVRVSRREAFRILDERFCDGAQFYKRSLLYELNLAQELMKTVESRIHDRFQSMVTMLRERGDETITIAHLKTLSPLSKEMQQHETDVDEWLEKRAKLMAEHARIKAEKDEDQRRREALALVAAENLKRIKAERAAAELKQKHADMEAARLAAIAEAERQAQAQKDELERFEREQQALLEAEKARQQREREEEEQRKADALAEIARQKRIAEKRREQKEIADQQRAVAAAAMAAKEQAELARLRRKAEARQKELEHARLLAEKKAQLKSEAEMKRKLAELEAKHQAELERVRKEQEAEAHKVRKAKEETAMLAALKVEAEERQLAHEREMAQLKASMEEQEARMREEKAQLAADRAAHEAEMAALAAAEEAARERSAAQAELDRARDAEEETKRETERYEQEQQELALQATEREAQSKEAQRQEEAAQRKADLESAKLRKQSELQAAREKAKLDQVEKQRKALGELEAKCKVDSCCTYKVTKQDLVYQAYYSCADCGDARMGGSCFCFQCAEQCHKGHDIKKEGEAPCFCDCGHAGAQTCFMMKPAAEQKALKAKSQVGTDHTVAGQASVHSHPDEGEHPCKAIIESLKAQGPDASWSDPDFPHDDAALFGGAEPMHPEWSGVKWARIKDICKGHDPTVFLPPVDANDIRQGCIDPDTQVMLHDGSVVAARDLTMDSLLRGETDEPVRISALVPPPVAPGVTRHWQRSDVMYDLTYLDGFTYRVTPTHRVPLFSADPLYVHVAADAPLGLRRSYVQAISSESLSHEQYGSRTWRYVYEDACNDIIASEHQLPTLVVADDVELRQRMLQSFYEAAARTGNDESRALLPGVLHEVTAEQLHRAFARGGSAWQSLRSPATPQVEKPDLPSSAPVDAPLLSSSPTLSMVRAGWNTSSRQLDLSAVPDRQGEALKVPSVLTQTRVWDANGRSTWTDVREGDAVSMLLILHNPLKADSTFGPEGKKKTSTLANVEAALDARCPRQPGVVIAEANSLADETSEIDSALAAIKMLPTNHVVACGQDAQKRWARVLSAQPCVANVVECLSPNGAPGIIFDLSKDDADLGREKIDRRVTVWFCAHPRVSYVLSQLVAAIDAAVSDQQPKLGRSTVTSLLAPIDAANEQAVSNQQQLHLPHDLLCFRSVEKVVQADQPYLSVEVDDPHLYALANGALTHNSLGNCYFLSACAVLTKKPEALMAVFVTKEYVPQGCYGLRFFKNGKIANVVVDDYLPIGPHSQAGGTLDPLFSKAKDSRGIWVMLIEKAFAKLHSCLSFGTLVRVHGQAEPVPVESLAVGSLLVGEDLSPVTVTRIGVGTAPSMIRISYDGGSHLVTHDHLVTLRCGRNPAVQLERPAGGATVLTLAWDEPTLNATGTDIRRSRSWHIVDAGVSAAHSISDDSDSDALPAEMAPFAEQFALWWLSGLQARSKGVYNPMRVGDLFELRASSLLTVSTTFLDCVGIPQAPPSDLAQLGWPDEAATVAAAPTVGTSPDRDLPGSCSSEIKLIECFLQMKGLTTGRDRMVHPTSSGSFPPGAVGTPDIVYVLHNPISVESMKNKRDQLALTIRVLEAMWGMLKVNAGAPGSQVMISEINPVVAQTSKMDSANIQFDDICKRAMEAAIMCGTDKLIVFGSYGYNRWMQTIDLCEGVHSTEMEYDEESGREFMIVTRDDGSTAQVLFTHHPSDRRLFRSVLATVAFAHGKVVPAAWVEHEEFKRVSSVEEVVGECNFVPIEVTGSGRFVLADNCITHNCYQNIEGGWIDDALVDLAGGVAERIRWEDEKTKTAIHDGSLWNTMLKYHEQGFLLGAGSPVGKSDSEADASPWGIVQSHAYSILSLVAVDGLQLIQLRNPWGRSEWKGDYSDASPLWTRRLKSKVNYVDKDDGAFWMLWSDFCTHYDELYVSKFFELSKWPSRGTVYGEWKGVTAGGCVNNVSVQNNVQYGLTVLDAGAADIAVTLLLEDVRGQEGKQAGDFPTVILEMYEHQGKPITQRSRGQQLASTCDNLQQIFIECTVQSDGKQTYTILPCCFEAGVETSYTLTWYCNKRAKLQQFQQPSNDDAVTATRR